MKKIFILTGEPSGDKLASTVISKFKENNLDVEYLSVGGYHLNSLGITQKVNSVDDLSISLVEEFKEDKAKNDEIAAKIQNYGQNIFNNVIIELKKYI